MNENDIYGKAGLRNVNASGESFDLIRELFIDPNDLNKAFVEHPTQFAFWAKVARDAKNEYEDALKRAKREERELRDVTYSRLYLFYKTKPDGGKKPTESEVDALVKTSAEYANHKSEVDALYDAADELKAHYNVLQDALEAFKVRTESLINLGAQYRAEMQSGVRIKAPLN